MAKARIAVDKLSPALGVEIGNIDLTSAAADKELVSELRSLLLRHKVLCKRHDLPTSPSWSG